MMQRQRDVFDISLPLTTQTPSFPGDPPFSRRPFFTYATDGCEVSSLCLSAHSGTHLDFPAHFLPEGKRGGDYPAAAFFRPAVVVDCGKRTILGEDVLQDVPTMPGDALLLCTSNSRERRFGGPDFPAAFVAATPGLGRELIRRQICLVGIDALSIEPLADPEYPVHHLLLAAGICLLEGLDLRDVPPGRYQLSCLPLAIPDAEASPVRAILLPASEPGTDTDSRPRATSKKISTEPDKLAQNPFRSIPMEQQADLAAMTRQAVNFHGHLCPGLALGIQAARLGLALCGHDGDEDVVAVVETDMCAVDAIQALMGCTFGKGNLVHRDYGKVAFTFYRRRDNAAVRLLARPDIAEQTDPEFVATREATLAKRCAQRILALDPESLFTRTAPATVVPGRAAILADLVCERCGETMMESRSRRFAGQTLCLPCFEAVEQKI